MSKIVRDSKLVLNHHFPEIVQRENYVVVPVVTGDGHVKELRIAPGAEPRQWIIPDWEKKGARFVKLKSVSLTTERLEEGCMFLQTAYQDEGWEDGWREYKRYMDAQYSREATDDNGATHRLPRKRANYVGHFPDELLPKAVLEMRGAKVKKTPKWEPSAGIKRPEDKAQPQLELESTAKAKGSKGA